MDLGLFADLGTGIAIQSRKRILLLTDLLSEADMKTFNSKMIVLLAAFSLMGTVGCGKNDQFVASSDATTTSTDVTLSPDILGATAGSNVVNFTPVSLSEMTAYVGIRPLNNPTNFRATINLTNVESGRYAGTVKISYTDNGVNYEGVFTAGSGRNVKMSGLDDNNVLEAEYNTWFVSGGKTVFNGVFQDNYGAIVLVVDNVVNMGDGQGGSTLSGSIYYRNFAQSYATQSPYRKCWFIRSGPYNCRSAAFVSKSSAQPTDTYRKLGTFTGLSKTAAFQ